jgi:ketosteroid isomerase-like protein
MRCSRRLLSIAVFVSGLVLVVPPSIPGSDDPREALMEADRQFARDTAARGADGWAETFLENGVMFPQAGRVEGREAIRKRMAGAFAPENPRLLWEPTDATVAASGELGYTLGHWRSVTAGAAGEDSILAAGNYVSIWKKDADGAWKVAVDIGNDGG